MSWYTQPVNAYKSNIFINEMYIHGSNDWIELYNPTADVINISNWSVYDSGGSRKASVKFSSTTIAPGEFVTVDMDNLLNFDTDTVYLYNTPYNTGTIIDAVSYPSLVVGTVPATVTGLTVSRRFDGSPDWVLQTATKGATNGSQATFEKTPQSKATPQTVTQYPEDLANTLTTWTFKTVDIINNNESADPGETSEHSFAEDPNPNVQNNAIIKLLPGPGKQTSLTTLRWSGIKLSDITNLAFEVHTNSPDSANLQLYVNFNSWGAGRWLSQNQAYRHGSIIFKPSTTPNAWNTYDPVASNGMWAWSEYENNGNMWPDGTVDRYRTWKDITSSFPRAYVSNTSLQYVYKQAFGGIEFGAEPNSAVYYDNVRLATKIENIVYNFASH